MNGLHKLVILLVFIYGASGSNITALSQPSTIINNKFCYPDSKHCFQCSQEASFIRFTKPFNQEVYRVPMMDSLNRARSQYAKTNGISNMKFTNWIQEFEAMTETLASFGSPITECTDISYGARANHNYKNLEFKSEIKLVRIKDRDQLVQDQFDNFTAQLIDTAVMMAYNLNEFGCCYTYIMQNSRLTTLMRCLAFIENRLNLTELKSGKLCDDCDHKSERCIELDWYEGLCVYQRFNETRLRLIFEPEVQHMSLFSYTMVTKLMFRSSIYVLNVIVLFLIVYVLYAACVICRHNRHYGMTCDDDSLEEYVMPKMENIYN